MIVGDDVVGIARGAAEEPGMQVALGGDDGELLADEAAEHDGDRRARRGSTCSVSQTSATSARSSAALAARNGGEVRAARLFLAFEDHRDLDRQRARRP